MKSTSRACASVPALGIGAAPSPRILRRSVRAAEVRRRGTVVVRASAEVVAT